MKVVVDTNVLVSGMNRLNTCGQVIDLWVNRDIVPCVSTALALEYEAVLLRHCKIRKAAKVQAALQALLSRAQFVPILFSYRPMSPDPADDMVIDCAMNAQAPIITMNTKDFVAAAEQLGLALYTPDSFINDRSREV